MHDARATSERTGDQPPEILVGMRLRARGIDRDVGGLLASVDRNLGDIVASGGPAQEGGGDAEPDGWRSALWPATESRVSPGASTSYAVDSVPGASP